ncbi:MAG: HAD-IIA family hydrolase [Methylomonas sp.]|nr:HAD-IIA family hydrolase [Methylomonas sp.]PPD20788.1 MAG: haloacid dehalogenase [Methylomonas sp.]PPD27289.1 MAG: haloacid dehalogenase [Methylomonas sp.]PPD39260.1 MAG: haloacid dehalogenase [Methylomonas sp.]PPD40742.1 MAG: haloacid dehalogenase [Methylomonas sp.]
MNLPNDVRGFIIDMDGVLWHGDKAQPGLQAFFQTLRDLNMAFILATNNAMATAGQYQSKLAAMGVAVEPAEILTSGMATAIYLARHYPPQTTRVFVIGDVGLKQPLLEQGFSLTGLDSIDDETGAHIVVCGLDKALSWDKLATATLNIRRGAAFYASNGDTTLPSERGLLPGNGATLAALHAATGVTPVILGKPEPVLYQRALELLAMDVGGIVAIGDRLDTDILGAVRTGMRSLMVLSGVSRRDDLAGLDYAPTWIVQDIQDITQALQKRHSEHSS